MLFTAPAAGRVMAINRGERRAFRSLVIQLSEAAINGAVVGLFAYGTYAFTCQALFKDWLWSVTIPDVVWGVVLCAVSCAIGTYLKS